MVCGANMYWSSYGPTAGWHCPREQDHDKIKGATPGLIQFGSITATPPKSHYQQLTEDELAFHKKKNNDYAGKGRENGNFERVAAIFSNYPGLKLSDPKVIAIVYAMKQIDCSLWSLATENELKVEGIDERLKDAHIYFKIVRCLLRDEA